MRPYRWRSFTWLTIVILLIGCASQPVDDRPPSWRDIAEPVRLEELEVVTGQTIYVPAYSEIYFGSGRTLDLAITLSVRNTDLSTPIILTSVRYYDTHGQQVREFLEQPVRLGAVASADFFVEENDPAGGLGANFIVEWVAEQAVDEPIVEAVMLSTVSNQGVSFVSLGRVISSTLMGDQR